MKPAWTVIAAVVALAVGIGIGATLLVSRGSEEDSPDGKTAEIRRLEEENARLTEIAGGTAGGTAKADSIPAASSTRKIPDAPHAVAGGAGAEPEAMASAVDDPRWFSDWKDGALRGVDWKALGLSVTKINPLVVEITEAVRNDQAPSGSTIATIQRESGSLMQAALKMHEKIGGDDANEYFSDPVVMANAMNTTLDAAGLPLTAEQASGIERTARYWNDKLDRLRETWGETTLKLTRLSEAAGLKDRFFEEAFRLLTAEQVETLNPAATADRIRLTIFSSAHLYSMRTRVIPFSDRAEIEAPLFGGVAYELRLTEDERKQAKGIYDDWFAALPSELLDQETDVLDLKGHPKAQRITAWAVREAELLGRIIAAVPLDPDRLARARGLGVIGVAVRKPE